MDAWLNGFLIALLCYRNDRSPPAIIVDEKLAQRFWGHRDSVGLRMDEPDPRNLTETARNPIWYRVRGVVRSVRREDLSGKSNPEGAYYFPFAQNTSNNYTIAVRAAADSAAEAQSVRSVRRGILNCRRLI